MQNALALLAGILFGLGLTIGGMVDPAKVLGFLDLAAIPTGGWDPSLAFVMGGALLVNAPVYWLIVRGRERPWAAASFALPTKTELDRRLLGGAALFGVGWGLGGYCPGPAISGLAYGAPQTFVFVAALLAGMTSHHWLYERQSWRAA